MLVLLDSQSLITASKTGGLFTGKLLHRLPSYAAWCGDLADFDILPDV
jgi:hypothetical protein